jgi:hypothetical protein
MMKYVSGLNLVMKSEGSEFGFCEFPRRRIDRCK